MRASPTTTRRGCALRGPFGVALLLAAAGAPAMATEACAPAGAAQVCYADPVARYGHDVLGATPEWGALVLRLEDGRTARIDLPPDAIFEDIAPRAVAPGALGLPEGVLAGVVTVQSGLRDGARLVVWAATEADGAVRLVRIAETPPIGRPFRWLAPLAIGDLDGDGIAEIAYVQTPHLRGLLRIWRLSDGALEEIAQAPGFSNHRIGENRIGGFLRVCDGVAELVTPDLSHRALMAARLVAGRIEAREIGRPDAAGIAAARACKD